MDSINNNFDILLSFLFPSLQQLRTQFTCTCCSLERLVYEQGTCVSGLQQTVIVNYFNRNFFRIIPISRPVILSELLLKVKTAYGQELSMNYVSNEVNLVIQTCMLFFRPNHSGPITTKQNICSRTRHRPILFFINVHVFRSFIFVYQSFCVLLSGKNYLPLGWFG